MKYATLETCGGGYFLFFIGVFTTAFFVFCLSNNIVNDLNMNHTPHEPRHTFITELDNLGANKTSIKRLAGDKRGDVTEKVYTHKDIEQLRKAVELLNF